jgi:hypothetical protein
METPLEPKKSLWKKSWKGPRLFLLILCPLAFIVILPIGLLSGIGKDDSMVLAICATAAVALVVIVLSIIGFFRWLFRPANLRKALFALACLITLIALFYAEEDARGKWAWNRFQRQWEAKGVKFDLESFIPPAVPDDQNFAMTPIMESTYGALIDKNGQEIIPHNTNVINRMVFEIYRDDDPNKITTNGNWAKATLTDLEWWQSYYRGPTTNKAGDITTNEFPIAPQPQTPAEDVLLALSKYDSTLEELRQASRMPYSRFPLEYHKDDPAMVYLPHLAKFRQSTMFLQLRAAAELQAGQTDKAADDVKLMLYLVNAPRVEPFLISHLVRVGVLNLTLQPIYEGLAEHKWSDAQLAAFDSDLAKLDFLADYQLSIRSEVIFSAKITDYILQTRKITPYLNLFNNNSQSGSPGWDFLCYLAPSGWFSQNKIRFSEFYLQKDLPAVSVENRQFLPKLAMDAEADLDASIAHPTPYSALKNVFLSQIRKWFNAKFIPTMKFAATQESVDLARVAIALERYRLAHNDYPDSLEVLTPQFIDKVPHDLIGGQPLKYRKTANNFVLYSIGWNEKDDGGVPAFIQDNPHWLVGSQDLENGDWVWTYPTK